MLGVHNILTVLALFTQIIARVHGHLVWLCQNTSSSRIASSVKVVLALPLETVLVGGERGIAVGGLGFGRIHLPNRKIILAREISTILIYVLNHLMATILNVFILVKGTLLTRIHHRRPYGRILTLCI